VLASTRTARSGYAVETMRKCLLVGFIALVSSATSSSAQVAPPSSGRAATPPPAPVAAPFPAGAKIAFVNVNAIAQNSAEGKAANAKIESLVKKKQSEAAAAGQKTPQDQQRFQQEAQQEVQKLQADLQNEFQQKLVPILRQMAQEKHLSALLGAQESGVIYAEPGLDLTAEAIRRLDAATPAAAAPKK
jgi:Skp family chaperone for outer membrane proteins